MTWSSLDNFHLYEENCYLIFLALTKRSGNKNDNIKFWSILDSKLIWRLNPGINLLMKNALFHSSSWTSWLLVQSKELFLIFTAIWFWAVNDLVSQDEEQKVSGKAHWRPLESANLLIQKPNSVARKHSRSALMEVLLFFHFQILAPHSLLISS